MGRKWNIGQAIGRILSETLGDETDYQIRVSLSSGKHLDVDHIADMGDYLLLGINYGRGIISNVSRPRNFHPDFWRIGRHHGRRVKVALFETILTVNKANVVDVQY